MKLVIVGGSDAGITAGLRARQLYPTADVHLMVADDYPNYSICGIPYHISGEVPDWHSLAHRTRQELHAAGLQLHLNERAVQIDPNAHVVRTESARNSQTVDYDRLIIATGAVPNRPPITGLDQLGPADGVHLLHTMDDTFAITHTLTTGARSAVIVGAGYIGLEMAEALRTRGLDVTVVEQLGQVLPRTLDPELALLIEDELVRNGVRVSCGTTVSSIDRAGSQLQVTVTGDRPTAPAEGFSTLSADLVLVVTGVRPDTQLAVAAGARTSASGALDVDTDMRTNLPDIYAAGDCVHTHHRLLAQPTYLPLGTTAHKQGRVAGENAVGGFATYAGSLGTQVVRVFDLVAAATGLRDTEATEAGYQAVTAATSAHDHKVYYPQATMIAQRLTADTTSRKLLGAQLVGHLTAQISKRVDVLAATLFYGGTVDDVGNLDLSYTPPLGSPYDAIQVAAHAWQSQQ